MCFSCMIRYYSILCETKQNIAEILPCVAIVCMTWMFAYWLNHSRLTHWGRVTHICVSKLTIIGSDNGLSPDRRQSIIWTNAGILLIGPLGTNFREILIEIRTFSFKKMHLKMSSGKWRPFVAASMCLGTSNYTCSYFHRPIIAPVRTVCVMPCTLIRPSVTFGTYSTKYADINYNKGFG